MIILAIETSCDETGVAILRDKQILSNVTISQILDHSEHGGVIPNLAARLHIQNISKVFAEALLISQLTVNEIDYVAYTAEPGLIICLQVGRVIAETISLFLQIPLIQCNHLLGHSYATLLNREQEWNFPALALTISGGHTQLYLVEGHCDFKLLGETLDDAIGECLDKIAFMMGYNYPGGPVIEDLALAGKGGTYNLTVPKNDKTLDFSFSGLKSEVKRIFLKDSDTVNKNDLSFSLQTTLTKVLTNKSRLALQKFNPVSFIIGGGVIANKAFRTALIAQAKHFNSKLTVFVPEPEYCTDNAAMIAMLAYYKVKSGKLSDS